MEFEWDTDKAEASLKKHGVGFDEAITVFDDLLAKIVNDEKHSGNEKREIIIGHSAANKLLFVCFTERETGKLRIISARKLTATERKDYEENADF